jgi:phenylacetate-CoA ligase
MFETGVRQLRMALSMVGGRPINPRNLERLVADAVATLEAFGSPGDDVREMLDGPFADPDGRRSFQEQALRRTARRLARLSPHYRARFGSLGLDPRRLTIDDMPQIPVTTKHDLVERPDDFVVDRARPAISTRTTGTTGRPAEVWLSRYELELWSALAALSGLLRDEIRPDDCMQINISSRATAAVHQNMSVCRLVGASSRPLGLVAPDESLDSLLAGGDRAPTLLATYPSYLAELVKAARRRGHGPGEFRLRRIDCGGEVLTPALVRAASETLGATVNDTFAMTEALPVSGRVCEQGHLHHDLNMGFVEVVDAATGDPTAPGEIGSVVITPYYPYRECMPVFRYDTRDVVRCLPDEPLTCEVAALPGTGPIVGKADQLLRLGPADVVTPRQLIEAIEALPARPWPARYQATVHDGRMRLTLPATAIAGFGETEAVRHFADHGLDVELAIVDDEAARSLRRVRSDLHETTFFARQALIGA